MTELSVIDTLTAGFDGVRKRVALVVIPVALDVFLWLGPKISIGPVIDRMLAMMSSAVESVAPSEGIDAGMGEMLDSTVEMLQGTLGRTNLLASLAIARLGVPSVASLSLIEPKTDTVIEIASYWQMLLLQVLILGVGLLIACLFLGALGQYTRGEDPSLPRLLGSTLTFWLYLAIIFVPFGIFLVFAISIAMVFGPLIVFVGVGIIWLMLYMSFVPQAITMFGEKPLRALLSSLSVVRGNFWSAVSILLLVNVLSTGMGLVWRWLMLQSTVGTLVAIAANAYVGTSLTLSLFIYYRDRVLLAAESTQPQRSA